MLPRYDLSVELNIHIRELRKKRGLSQKELGEMVGISHAHVSEVERGIKNLNNHLLERFAVALGVQPERLIASEAQKDYFRLDDTMRKLSPEDRERVEAFAAALYHSRKDTAPIE